MIPDTRILARAGAHEIRAQRLEAMFRDGSVVSLHPVSRAGVPQHLLRALATDSGGFVLFDLEQLNNKLGGELRGAPERDRIGLVFYGLRALFPSKAAFVVAVRRCALAEVLCVPLPAAEPGVAAA